jgi:hypothetical protein
LPQGEHTIGLRSVLQHIQVALNHLARGQNTGDETAFTDAIYRTNQAFEGSLKEAYRVLTGKDPSTTRPFDIENRFQAEKLLRPRVLSQFTTYRRDWRNPSAHDYRLDFDEDEALLAIVSVCAFAIVLVDQVAEKLGFDSAKRAAQPVATVKEVPGPLLEHLVSALERFVYQQPQQAPEPGYSHAHVLGAIAGYLTGTLPRAMIEIDKILNPSHPERVDIFVTRGDERVIIELRRGQWLARLFRDTRYETLVRYMSMSGAKESVVYSPRHTQGEMIREDFVMRGEGLRIVELRPKPVPSSSA